MLISVHHTINDVGSFWNAAQKNLPNLPETGVYKVSHVFPSADMSQATCIWEADSVEVLDKYLRSKVGDASTETYFEINTANAIGLA